MPKRLRSDDEENYCRYLKTHVSEQELCTGVLKEQNQKSIYEKTLALLFRGQKNLANNNAVLNQVEVAPSKDRLKYRQLALSSSGSRINPDSRVNMPEYKCRSCINTNCQPTKYSCNVCSGIIGSLCVQLCSSCQSASCSSCDGVKQCSGCYNMFCQNCVYASSMSEVVCSLCIS